MRLIIAYDVADDDDRARVAALLLQFGVRVQLSVYECVLEADDLEDLLVRASELLEPGYDRLLVLPQCEDCLKGRRVVGPQRGILDESFYVV